MSNKNTAVPITIITGFLGAGKTSLLNHILHSDHGLRVAVLVNDFGSINIDSELIVGVEGETISLSNGCICCTIRDDLLTAVFNLFQRETLPEYIVIETSGVSDPFSVAQTFLMPALRPYVQVDSIVTVVDTEQARSLEGEQAVLAMDQIGAADFVVLNKIDLVTPDELEAVQRWIRDVTPNARTLEVTHGRTPLELILSVGEYSPERLAARENRDAHVHVAGEPTDHDHAHAHDLVFNTWSYKTDEPLVYEALCAAIDNLPTTIFRAKGIVYLKETPDRKAVMQVVGRRAQLTFSGQWGDQTPRTRIVVIGSHSGVDPDELQKLFDASRVSEVTAKEQDKLGQALSWVRKKWSKASA